MRPTAHLPRLIAALVLLVCLVAATPAAARRPSLAITSSNALNAGTAKAPYLYESFWPHVLLRVPSLAVPHPLQIVPVRKTPAVEVFRPAQILEPVRRRPSIDIFRPPQILEPMRKTPSHPVFRPPQILEPIRKTPSVAVFRPEQIGR